MTRRFFGIGLTAMLAGCSGAGVTTTDLRGKIAPEIAQVVVNRDRLLPGAEAAALDPAQVDAVIAATRAQVSARHAAAFEVAQLHDLRRFYSSRDGQAVVSLAWAAESGREKPALDVAQFSRVEASLADPVVARSVSILRGVLRESYSAGIAG